MSYEKNFIEQNILIIKYNLSIGNQYINEYLSVKNTPLVEGFYN